MASMDGSGAAGLGSTPENGRKVLGRGGSILTPSSGDAAITASSPQDRKESRCSERSFRSRSLIDLYHRYNKNSALKNQAYRANSAPPSPFPPTGLAGASSSASPCASAMRPTETSLPASSSLMPMLSGAVCVQGATGEPGASAPVVAGTEFWLICGSAYGCCPGVDARVGIGGGGDFLVWGCVGARYV